jgi:hypothetical protein
MRIVSSLLLVAILAGCQLALPGQGDPSDSGPKVNPITGAAMTDSASAIAVTTLDAPPTATTTPPASTSSVSFRPLPPQTAPRSTAPPAAPPPAAPAAKPAQKAEGAPAETAVSEAKAAPKPETAPKPEAQAKAEPSTPQLLAEPAPPPAPKTPAQIACEKRKGVWSKAGANGANYCQTLTRDGGKSCTRSTQCEGYCLAKSNTCAPATPLLGCHDILTEDGKFLTQCIN